MISLLAKLFIKDKEDLCCPQVKKAYAALASITGILLNLLLCAAKITVGALSHSIAISADGFNNLADAGTSMLSFLGFKIAGYGGGSIHPFGHGRIEWIMSIFTSCAVIFMGAELAHTAALAVTNPQKPLFSAAIVIVLSLSILVKGYMYFYNKRIAKMADSETLKAVAADCISDSAATFAVLLSAIVTHLTGWKIDGYCGILVSLFIIFAGIKSLWEVLGRIMGKTPDENLLQDILTSVKEHPQVTDVYDLMIHDYGFGYFVVSMHIAGGKEHSEHLNMAAEEASFVLYKKYHCDAFIQVDYLIDDDALAEKSKRIVNLVLQKYGDRLAVDHFRLVESGPHIKVVFDLLYPADLQNQEEELRQEVEKAFDAEGDTYLVMIKGILRRERFCRTETAAQQRICRDGTA